MPDGRFLEAPAMDFSEILRVAHGPMAEVALLRTRPVQHLVVVGGHYEWTAQPPDGARQVESRRSHALRRRIELRFEKFEPVRSQRVASYFGCVQIFLVFQA